MSNCVAFHTQIASIMEVLANAAVAEICKVVDDGYAVLRVEMSQSLKENKALKRKLQMMELRGARGCAEKSSNVTNTRPHGAQSCDKMRTATESHFPGDAGVFGRPLDGQRRDGDAPGVDQDRIPRDECAGVEEGRTESLLIKEERLEEDSDPHGEMDVREERAVGSRAGGGGRPPVQETQNKAENHTEEFTEQHRTRHGVWERADVEEERGSDSSLVKEESAEMAPRACSTPGGAVEMGAAPGGRPRTLNTQTPPPAHLPEQHWMPHSVLECAAGVEEGRTESLLIKEERLEEDSDPQGEMSVREERFVESDSDSVEQAPSVDLLTPPTVCRQTRHGVWEPADREQQSLGAFGIKEEPPEGALESADPHGEPKNSGERGGGLDSLTHERPGPLGTLVPQWTPDTEARDSYSTETAQSGVSFSGCSDATPEAVSAGPVPASEAFETRGGRRGDEGQSQEHAQIPSAESSLVSDGPATGELQLVDDCFAASPFLRPHRKACAQKRRFLCKYCGKGFPRAKELEIHQRVHTGEKPFICAVCGKRFTQSCNLKTHLRVHNGEKPFICAVCGKDFASFSHLKRHQSVHSRKGRDAV